MAERTLNEYTEFAAWQMGRTIWWDLSSGVSRRASVVLARLGADDPTQPLPSLDQVEEVYKVQFPPLLYGTGSRHREIGAFETYFRYFPRSEVLELRGRYEDDAVLRSALESTLRIYHREVWARWGSNFLGSGSSAGGMFLLPDEAPVRLATLAPPVALAPDPDILFGILFDPVQIQPVFDRIFDEVPVLPPSVTRGLNNRELLEAKLWHEPSGVTLLASPLIDGATETSDIALSELFPGMRLQLALSDQARAQLLEGAPTGVRPGALILLLSMNLGLLGLTAFKLRQEYSFIRLRADFVAGVSHELRTPIAQIRMFGETLLLNRTRNERERTRAAEIIVQEAGRLNNLVDSVLLFSRNQRNGGMTPELEEADLSSLVREAIEAFEPIARARDAALVLEAPDHVPLRMDSDLVRQAVLNLLDNALKYGPRGQTIRVSIATAEGEVVLAVEDEGSGVAGPDRERVWEPFVRAERQRSTHVAGAGIGLALIRDIMRAHSGDGTIESGPGGGCRAILTFPSEEGTDRGSEASRGLESPNAKLPAPAGAFILQNKGST